MASSSSSGAGRSNFYSTTALLALFASILAIYYNGLYSGFNPPGAPRQPDWLGANESQQSLHTFRRAAVTSDATVCNRMGDHVLNVLNGNAVDATVTAILCLGVVHPHCSGLGGGATLLLYDRKLGETKTITFREAAPGKSNATMFNTLPLEATEVGALSIAVPGEVRGLSHVHSKYGRLPWRTLVMPIVKMLRDGREVTPTLRHGLTRKRLRDLSDEAQFREIKQWLRNPATGVIYEANELIKDEKMAVTMEQVANDPESFYNGDLARDIAQELQEAGSIITLEDLQAYQVTESPAISVALQNCQLRLFTSPPPSAGGILAFVLNLLDGFNMNSTMKHNLDSYVTFHHRLIEALKFGFAHRPFLSDQRFTNVTALVADLTSPIYADKIRSRIHDDVTHGSEYYGPTFDWQPDHGTTHVSVVDSEGNAVSVTASISNFFGSMVRGRKTGIFYNNGMRLFAMPQRTKNSEYRPSSANFIQPGKRPVSTFAPAIVVDAEGNLRFVSGSAGGIRIMSGMATTLARMIYFNETIKEATDVFRVHHHLLPNAVEYHKNLGVPPLEILQALESRGHVIVNQSFYNSIVQTIAVLPDGRLQASGDFRKPSQPWGH